MSSQAMLPSSVWLITGATSGFGQQFAISALSRGERVIATGRSQEKLESFLKALKPEYHERVKIELLDVTAGEEEIKSSVERAAKHWGGIDVVINNAGVGYPSLMEEGGSKLLRRQFETNVFGVVDVSTAALPYLRRSENGRLLIVGSRSAWAAERLGTGFYATSKAAVTAVAENLMAELAPFNIKVTLILPGGFRTPGITTNKFNTDNKLPIYDELREKIIKKFAAIDGAQPNDLEKAATVVVDVVQGVGIAQGRPWPSYLVLGEDGEADIRAKCNKLLENMDEWVDVTRGVKISGSSLN